MASLAIDSCCCCPRLTKSFFAFAFPVLSNIFAEKEYMHHGMTRVIITPGIYPLTLTGDYYADRSRHSSGPVKLIKKA
jgi:hypothetical protein